jgi:hypothetical protein
LLAAGVGSTGALGASRIGAALVNVTGAAAGAGATGAGARRRARNTINASA